MREEAGRGREGGGREGEGGREGRREGGKRIRYRWTSNFCNLLQVRVFFC